MAPLRVRELQLCPQLSPEVAVFFSRCLAAVTMTSPTNGDRMDNQGNGRFRAQFWKTETCRFWRSGCRNGRLCPFAHGEEELTCRPDLCKTSLCQRWAKGACPLEADECRFAHGRLDLRATPNFMHGQGEMLEDGQPMEGFGNLDSEATLQGNGANPQGGSSSQQPPWMRQEECFSDAQTYMNGGASVDMMSWGNRSHNGNANHGGEAILDQMQAVLAQRDWQWSPEYGDGLQDGDARQAARRSRRLRAAKATTPEAIGPQGLGHIVPPVGSSNGRPAGQLPPQLQMLLMNGDDAHGQDLDAGPQVWPPYHDGGSSFMGGGAWVDDMQARVHMQTYAGGMEQRYGAVPEASEFPHAITAPDVNIMHPTVPQEVRAIWS